MSNVLFCMPIKKDKTNDYKAFIKNCLEEKQQDYRDLLLRYNLNTVKMWIHTIDGRDYALFTHDMTEDAAKRLEDWPHSLHPFDQWFKAQLKDCYDVENINEPPAQPIFFGELDARKD